MWEKLLAKVQAVQKDKIYHFFAGLVIGVIFAYFHPIAGLAAAVIAGVAKELYDRHKYGGFDVWDLVATVLGGIVAAGIASFGYWS